MNIRASAGTTAPYPCKVQLEERSTLGPFIMVPRTVSLKKNCKGKFYLVANFRTSSPGAVISRWPEMLLPKLEVLKSSSWIKHNSALRLWIFFNIIVETKLGVKKFERFWRLNAMKGKFQHTYVSCDIKILESSSSESGQVGNRLRKRKSICSLEEKRKYLK